MGCDGKRKENLPTARVKEGKNFKFDDTTQSHTKERGRLADFLHEVTVDSPQKTVGGATRRHAGNAFLDQARRE